MSQPPEEVSRWQTYPGEPGAQPAADPPLPVGPLPPVPVPTGPGGLGRPGYHPNDPLVLAAGGDGLKKESAWTAPPYLSLRGDLGSIRLDFRRAEVVSQVIWMQVSGGMGSIVIILPEGWAAQLDRLAPSWGSRKSTVAEQPVGNNPVLVLTGSMGMGSLQVRYPTRADERRLPRLIRKEQKKLR